MGRSFMCADTLGSERVKRIYKEGVGGAAGRVVRAGGDGGVCFVNLMLVFAREHISFTTQPTVKLKFNYVQRILNSFGTITISGVYAIPSLVLLTVSQIPTKSNHSHRVQAS